MPEFTGATDKSKLIEPVVFADYIIEKSTATNRLLTSGILTNDPLIQAQLLQGGTFITIPAMMPLGADVQTWNDTKDISVNSLSTESSNAIKMYQAQAFGYTDFGALTTGSPVAEAIAGQFSNYWNIQDNKLIIAVLANAFKNADLLTAKSYGAATPAELKAGDFLAAISRMGDIASPTLVKLIVNSATLGAMREQNLIDDIQPSTGGAPISTYNNMQIITDDAIPLAADGTTDAYITANGAIAYGLASPANAVETKRDALGNGGQNAVINRRVLSMQVKGTGFTDTTKAANVGISTYNDSSTSLFSIVGDPRNIGVVDYRFKIDPKFVVGGINSPKA